MRESLRREGVNPDVFQCVERPSIPLSHYLMASCDLVQATGGRDMVKAAYSSGGPSLGVGAGNSTMVIDETADVDQAARNTRISKTSDFGSGCSADGNLIVEASVYDAFLAQLRKEGGHLASPEEKDRLQAVLWDAEGHRTSDTVAISAQRIAARAVFEVGGKGHSCGIYSHDDERIHRLAMMAPVSRIMVRQPQSKANAGAFDNGMPMTSSLGCGTWGGNITSENINLRHYMNVTWVSRPIPEDRPSERELFGEFYGTETF